MIKIGLTTTNSFLSGLVRKVTGSKVSHVVLVFDDPIFGTTMVLGAEINGYVLQTLTQFQRTNKIVALVEPAVDLSMGLRAVRDELDTAYDFGGLFGAAWTVLGRWLRLKWRNPFDNPHQVFCSEVVAQVLLCVNYPGAIGLIPNQTTPQDLYKLLVG